jgi:hypothetical protein
MWVREVIQVVRAAAAQAAREGRMTQEKGPRATGLRSDGPEFESCM